MASHPDDCEAMIAAARAAGKVAAVQMQHVGRKSMLDLRERIAAGAIGELRVVRVASVWARSEAYYSRTGWAGRMKVDGKWCVDGALYNQCSHYLYQALTLARPGELPGAAEAMDVTAEIYKFHDAPTLEAGDTAFIVGRLDVPGRPKFVAVGTTCGSGEERHWVELVGTKGRATWNGVGRLMVEGRDVEEFSDDRLEFEGDSVVFNSFAEAVRGRGNVLTPFGSVKAATQLINDSYEACGWRVRKMPSERMGEVVMDMMERVLTEGRLPTEKMRQPVQS
jgi:predicted dehydrogenase